VRRWTPSEAASVRLPLSLVTVSLIFKTGLWGGKNPENLTPLTRELPVETMFSLGKFTILMHSFNLLLCLQRLYNMIRFLSKIQLAFHLCRLLAKGQAHHIITCSHSAVFMSLCGFLYSILHL
jgi:hypothetical protein